MTKVTSKLVVYSTIGILLGVLITIYAIPLAGHGDGWGIGNRLTPVLYPYSVLMLLLPFEIAFVATLVIAVCQFPIYGLLLGDAAATGARRFAWTTMGIGVAHGLAVGICLGVLKIS